MVVDIVNRRAELGVYTEHAIYEIDRRLGMCIDEAAHSAARCHHPRPLHAAQPRAHPPAGGARLAHLDLAMGNLNVWVDGMAVTALLDWKFRAFVPPPPVGVPPP